MMCVDRVARDRPASGLIQQHRSEMLLVGHGGCGMRWGRDRARVKPCGTCGRADRIPAQNVKRPALTQPGKTAHHGNVPTCVVPTPDARRPTCPGCCMYRNLLRLAGFPHRPIPSSCLNSPHAFSPSGLPATNDRYSPGTFGPDKPPKLRSAVSPRAPLSA